MMRKSSTNIFDESFDQPTINAVWNKGKIVSGADPNVLRKDVCGAWIRKGLYGTTQNNGWEIDHIKPVSHGGTDVLTNLQPLYWQNNRHKGDNYPNWTCAVPA